MKTDKHENPKQGNENLRQNALITLGAMIGMPLTMIGITQLLNHHFVPYDDLCLLIRNTIEPKVLDKQLSERCYRKK